ncbi:hypothetical protein [Streptomyces sp. NPDC003522]
MRVRATTTVAALVGAVALSALAAPAAQAAPAGPAVTFSNLKVNAGKPVVVGPTAQVTVTATYTVTKPASLRALGTAPVLYRGATLDLYADDVIGGDDAGVCTTVSSTVLKCTAKIQFRPKATGEDIDLVNGQAGSWKLGALAANDSGGLTWRGDLGTAKVLRASKLTADATPEPVKKGKTLTVTGKLSRANWDSNTYAGYSGQSVKLQFRKKGSTTYTTVKTIKTSSTGVLKTTVKATADGYYRYSFAGTSTTPAATATADFVDVR